MDAEGIHRVYISGPITDMPDCNRSAFADAENKLRALGYDPVNPLHNGLPPDAAWARHMKADIKLLMDCDALVWLDGWDKSRGARIEIKLADGLGMPAVALCDLLRATVRRVA